MKETIKEEEKGIPTSVQKMIADSVDGMERNFVKTFSRSI
jgi:hypothetical protein